MRVCERATTFRWNPSAFGLLNAPCIAEAQQATHFLLSGRSLAAVFSINHKTGPAISANKIGIL
jgi:hypothetical protein